MVGGTARIGTAADRRMGRGARPVARACVAEFRKALWRAARRLSRRLPGETRVADDRREWRRPCRDRGRGGLCRSGAYDAGGDRADRDVAGRSEEHTSELQSLMRIAYAVFCLKKK